MTQEHPITPPPELFKQWFKQWEDDILNERDSVDHVLDRAWRDGFRAGADQELEACCEWAAEQDRGFDDELRAALAQPEPQGPTDEELLQVAASSIAPYENCGIAIGEYEAETEHALEAYGSELITFARAVLACWGRPTSEENFND